MFKKAGSRFSLRGKLTVLVAVVVLLMSAVSMVEFQRMWAYQGKMLDLQFNEYAVANAKTLSEKVERHFDKLRSLASQPEVAELELDKLLPYLKAPLEGSGHFMESTAAIDPDGSSISAEGTKANLGDRDYFKAIMSGSDRVISDPVMSRFSNSPVVLLCVPVKKDGKTVRELHGRIDLNRFYDGYIANLKYGNYGSAAVINTKGTIIAHPDKELIMKKIDDAAVPAELQAAYREMLNRKTGKVSYQSNGRTYTAYYQLVPETNWILAVSTSHDEVFAPLKRVRAAAFAGQGTSLVVFVAVTLLLVNTALGPLKKLAAASRKVAEGNLRVEVAAETRDEVGSVAHAFGEMLISLKEVVSAIKSKSDELSAAAEQLAANAEQTSGGSLKIASVVQEVSAIAENVAEDVKKVDAEAKAVGGMIESGQASLRNVSAQVEKMSGIAERVGAVMGELRAAAGQIGEMVEVITEIADQTKLLSLNAAIEAARAGEQGRGFAVVASEVKRLSEGAAGSAKRIQEVIRSVENKVAEVGAAVEDVVAESGRSVQAVADVDAVFSSLFSELGQLIAQFSSTAAQVEEISRSVQEVSGAVQESSAAAQEVSSSADMLNEAAAELKKLVGKFAG